MEKTKKELLERKRVYLEGGPGGKEELGLQGEQREYDEQLQRDKLERTNSSSKLPPFLQPHKTTEEKETKDKQNEGLSRNEKLSIQKIKLDEAAYNQVSKYFDLEDEVLPSYHNQEFPQHETASESAPSPLLMSTQSYTPKTPSHRTYAPPSPMTAGMGNGQTVDELINWVGGLAGEFDDDDI